MEENKVIEQENEIVEQKSETAETKEKTKFKKFIDFLVVSFNGMAYGLFATLIVGVIIQQIGNLVLKIDALEMFGNYILQLSTILKGLMGIGIGIGMAYTLKMDGLKMVVTAVVGGLASRFTYLHIADAKPLNDPMVVYFCVISVYLFFTHVMKKKTPVDIVIIPLIGVTLGFIVAFIVGMPITWFMNLLENFIQSATTYAPFISGVLISVFMGMFLTMPISSAAIAIAINLGGIAGGAAVVGCCVQMLGFAVMSRKDNDIGTVIGVGIGTSMLQFKNIIKKPIIWLPTIIVSAILGPLATLVFKTETTPIGAGMGTSGLVGQFGTIDAMGWTMNAFYSIVILQIILPIVLVYILDVIFRKKGLIKPGDLKI
ncbi:MAG: PTS sugar transporter subunit IIC [Acholeplasmataceae bacterium]|jgi:uncharacterized membrane protein